MPESTRLDTRKIGWGALAILCGIAFAVVGAWVLLRATGPGGNTPPYADTVPSPRLQTARVPERVTYFAEEERLTTAYGWADREAGIARVPLAEVMHLTAARAARKEGQR